MSSLDRQRVAKAARLARLRMGAAFFLVLFGSIAGAALQFVFQLLGARAFGANALGEFAQALNFQLMLSSAGRSGLDLIVLQLCSRSNNAQTRSALLAVLKKVLLISGALSLSCMLVLILFLAIGKGWSLQENISNILLILCAPLAAISSLSAFAIRGIGLSALSVAVEKIATPGAGLFALILLAPILANGQILGVAYALGILIAFALSIYLIATKIGSQPVGKSSEQDLKYNTAAELIRQGRPLIVFVAFATAFQAGMPLLLSAFMTQGDFGVFSVALRVAYTVYLPFLAVDAYFSSAIAKAIEISTRREVTRRLLRIAAGSALIHIISGAPLIIFSGRIMSLFGPEFTTGSAELRILTFAFIINGLFGPVTSALIFAGSRKEAAVANGISLAVAAGIVAFGHAVQWMAIGGLAYVAYFSILRVLSCVGLYRWKLREPIVGAIVGK